jgi:hypothetical protein
VRLFTARRVAALLVLLVAYYVVVIGGRAVTLVRDGRTPFRLLGVGLLLLAAVGVWLVAAEVVFGLRAERLARLAGDTGPGDFDAAKGAVEAAPEDWRAWYDLARAYRDERDPARGRRAMRRAIALERAVR